MHLLAVRIGTGLKGVRRQDAQKYPKRNSSGGCDQVQMITVKQIKDKCRPGAVAVTIGGNDSRKEQTIDLHRERSGCCDRLFFLCPSCGKKSVVLYLSGKGWTCRTCCPVSPYEGIQNKTKGGADEIGYRMKRYANLKGISFDYPFSYTAFALDDRTRQEGFRNSLKVLQALENMRTQALFFGNRYTVKDFRQVTTLKHPLMKTCSCSDLQQYLYDWHTGKVIQMDRNTIQASLVKTMNRGK